MENDLYCQYTHLGELTEAIDEVQVKKVFGKCDYLENIICFIYSSTMEFLKKDIK